MPTPPRTRGCNSDARSKGPSNARHRDGTAGRRRAGADRPQGRESSHWNLVSDADRVAVECTIDNLRRLAPHDAILSEEGGFQPGRSGGPAGLWPVQGGLAAGELVPNDGPSGGIDGGPSCEVAPYGRWAQGVKSSMRLDRRFGSRRHVEQLSIRERERIAELVAEGASFWRLRQQVPRSRYAIYRAVRRLLRPPAPEPTRSALCLSLAEREEIRVAWREASRCGASPGGWAEHHRPCRGRSPATAGAPAIGLATPIVRRCV
jgi:hypothetical protein